jgi:hypothetical protein
MKKMLLFICLYLCNKPLLIAQLEPQSQITPEFITSNFQSDFLKNKKIDSTFYLQTIGALMYYPELKNTKIKVVVKKSKTPLTARPSIWAVFQRSQNRKYIITISTETAARLQPILLKNLSFNAQIGVLGHELSHLSFFQEKKGLYFIRLLGMHLNRKSIDIFENDTDKRCINHGLGHQLLAWSSEVRANLKITHWAGVKHAKNMKRERYMSPQSIIDYMKLINYKQITN